MRFCTPALTIFITLSLYTPAADAQTAVIDSANLAQNLQTAAQAIIAVEQLKAQLTQLQQTYQMFTNPTDITGMASGLENQAVENPMPAANALAGLLGGQSQPPGAGQAFYNQNHVYSPTDGSAASTQLNANAAAIANIQGMAATN
jgi:type IV secretion system protein VirB5